MKKKKKLEFPPKNPRVIKISRPLLPYFTASKAVTRRLSGTVQNQSNFKSAVTEPFDRAHAERIALDATLAANALAIAVASLTTDP